MRTFTIKQEKNTKRYIVEVTVNGKTSEIASSLDLMELLAIVYEMCEPERVQQQLGGGLQ